MSTHRIPTLAALVVATVLPAVARAQSAATSNGTTIHACTIPVSGTLYLIKEPGLPQSCAAGHTEVSWSDAAGAPTGGTLAPNGGANPNNVAGGDLAGTYPSPLVAGLQGRALSATAPATGQLLGWSGTQWAPATPAAALDSNKVVVLDANGAATGGILARGVSGVGGQPTGVGAIPASGQGTRLMWYPAKAAFRTGFVDGAQWDAPNVGLGSAAFGSNTIASGFNAFAIGRSSKATSLHAFAGGDNSLASGVVSFAFGGSALATGGSSIALGTLVEAGGSESVAIGANAKAMHKGSFVASAASNLFVDFPSQADREIALRGAGGIRLRTSDNGSTGCNLPAGSGVWQCTSSRALKTNFTPLDGEQVLGKLRAMPVQSWSYTTEGGVRHVGPFAEDFHRAFGVGTDSTSIGVLDESGVALTGVKALETRTASLRTEITALRAQLDSVRRDQAALRALVRSLDARGARLEWPR